MKQLRLGEAGHSAGRRKNWAWKPGGTQCLYHDTKCQRLQTCGLRVKPGSQRYFVWPTQYVQKHLNSLPVFKNWDLHMKKQNPFFSYFSRKKKENLQVGNTGPAFPPGIGWQELAPRSPRSPAPQSPPLPVAFPAPRLSVVAHGSSCVFFTFLMLPLHGRGGRRACWPPAPLGALPASDHSGLGLLVIFLHRLRGKSSRWLESDSSTRRLGKHPMIPLLLRPSHRPPPRSSGLLTIGATFLAVLTLGTRPFFFFLPSEPPTIFFLILLRRTITRIIMKPEPMSMRHSPLQPSDRFVSAQSCLFKLFAGRSLAQGSSGAFSGRCSGPLQGPTARARSWCWNPGSGGGGG